MDGELGFFVFLLFFFSFLLILLLFVFLLGCSAVNLGIRACYAFGSFFFFFFFLLFEVHWAGLVYLLFPFFLFFFLEPRFVLGFVLVVFNRASRILF